MIGAMAPWGARLFVGALCWGILSASSSFSSSLPAKGKLIVLDSLELPAQFGVGANPVTEVSGLAWDQDDKILYAESDSAILYALKIEIADEKIKSVTPLFSAQLTLDLGNKIYNDAEDITLLNASNGITGDTEIAVVFEDGPIAGVFNTKGQMLRVVELPPPLNKARAFPSKNQTVESLSYAPRHGFIFAPQTYLSSDDELKHIYAEDGTVWSYKALDKKQRDNTSSMQYQPDGSMMMLAGVPRSGLLAKIELSGHETYLRQILLNSCDTGSICDEITYAGNDLATITDRYEALTHLSDNLFLLATDQPAGTRLTLVKIVKP